MAVTINTNLSSMLVQMNLQQSTFDLNKAIERMTTGYKLNHASDNAANYSISQNMVSKICSYDVASDNISSGMDLVMTAQDSISLLQQHGERIHNLITQAQNGTYGEESLAAINAEVQARIAEIDRIYASTEYNGINILEGLKLPDWIKDLQAALNGDAEAAERAGIPEGVDLTPKYNGFIEEAHHIDDATVNTMTHVAGLSDFSGGDTFAVSTAEDLANLAELVNSGVDTAGKTFVMGADINLTQWCNEHEATGGWNPIGNNDDKFEGIFDGNGHKIKGVKINREDTDYQGVFGSSSGELKNVGAEGVNIKGNTATGGLVGYALGSVTNSYATGSVVGNNYTGGIVGNSSATITNSYATGSVDGNVYTGGLVGNAAGAITNSFSSSSISGNNYTGGLAGYGRSSITNTYATGSIAGNNRTGGLVGYGNLNCTIANSYATGSVTGNDYIGGLAGYVASSVTNCYATGSITGDGNWVGGLFGQIYKTSGTLNFDKIASVGTVSSQGSLAVGSLIGGIVDTTNGMSFSTINITEASALDSSLSMIGFEGKNDGSPRESGQMEGWLSNITKLIKPSNTIQVGIHGDNSSKITFESSIEYDLSELISKGAEDVGAFDVINKFLNDLSKRATEIGAVYNKLDSALESTSVVMENITSSLSTIRDADIAKESSAYIKSQILQQASATLLATANQSPSIALQLL